MPHREFALLWAIACLVIVGATADAQNKTAAPSITVYQDPT